MKLRILNNSIRLRLSQAEVQSLLNDGAVSCQTQFGLATGPKLVYSLHNAGDAAQASASFSDGKITIQLPSQTVQQWATTAQVSIRAEQPIQDGVLKILVEKDFKCLTDRPDEDESDLFPNPLERHKDC